MIAVYTLIAIWCAKPHQTRWKEDVQAAIGKQVECRKRLMDCMTDRVRNQTIDFKPDDQKQRCLEAELK